MQVANHPEAPWRNFGENNLAKASWRGCADNVDGGVARLRIFNRPCPRNHATVSEQHPSFQHFPGPVRSFARAVVVIKDPLVPAPALLRGPSSVWVLNKSGTQSYLLGKVKTEAGGTFFRLG